MSSARTDTNVEKNKEQLLATLEHNWQAEMQGAATYRELAAMEKDKALLIKLAEAEERHAARWAGRIKELGGSNPAASGLNVGSSRQITLTAQVSDLDTALRRVESMEDAHVKEYQSQAETLGDPAIGIILGELVRDEASHARTLRAITGDVPISEPQSRLDSMLRREKWHGKSGSWIGDAIYGINDGLTAVFGIVAGVAGYSTDHNFIVAAGLSGALASALSMGASAFLANKAEREVYEAEISRERGEIEQNPEEEREELELFYQLKGLSEEESRALVERMAERPEQFLRTLAYEELGLSEDRLPNPIFSAMVGTLSTALGALVPVFPFFFLVGTPGIAVSAVISIAAHFAVGSKSLVTLRSWWKSGAEMTTVALIVAAIAYGLGHVLEVALR
ncbi:MAG: VIT1/CCC1 transporter family protein [Bacteroidetes bacterium]|nr:VIT1/CCC1 transporter family protein [Bacteroidota bacterium]